jgi:multidrug efflux pump subunit AcrA (membrane-fusion protein)
MRPISSISFIILSLAAVSCHSGNKEEDEKTQTRTLVTLTSATLGTLADTVELNAVSSFLLKTNVKATVNGYLQEVYIKLGEKVSKDQILFKVKSKEASSIGNTLSNIDTSFHFSGLTNIKSPGTGYITQLAMQNGDYIQDGETLAVISDVNSLVFMLDLPYELRSYLTLNKTISLLLPDGKKIPGTISSSLPFVDPVSQTQSYIIRVNLNQSFPENLIAKVAFVKQVKTNVVSLPKKAILANEQQTQFWIMKMTDSTTAVKVPIQKGLETTDRVEIVSPELKPTDKILLTGNYGLPDTARVVVEKEAP